MNQQLIRIFLLFGLILSNISTSWALKDRDQDSLSYLELTQQLNYRDTIENWVPKSTPKEPKMPDESDFPVGPSYSNPSVDAVFQVIGFAIIALLAIVLIIYLFKLKLPKKKSAIQDQDLDQIENIEDINLTDLLESALNDQDYRAAVRIRFLKILQVLNERKEIKWKPYKTNRDYVEELKTRSFGAAFQGLSFWFDHIWYGLKEVSKEEYHQYETSILSFEKSLDNESL